MSKKGNLKWLFVIVFAMSLVLAACAGGSDSKGEDKNEDKKESGAETETGGDLTLAVLSDASSLDPAGSNDVPSSVVQNNIYETLVNRNDENEIIEGLATEWEAVDDSTYEFKLREGVKFHDGEPFTADVVKANLDRILDAEVASPRYFLFEMISNVEVVDEHTVRITTEYPFAPLLAHLSHNGGAMVSPKSIEDDYAAMKDGKDAGSVISNNPIGTGFFKFESWNPGSEIKLVKNDDYWGEKVHLDSVTFKVIPESTTRNADLERGFVQIADPIQPVEVAEINNSDYATVLQKPSSSLSYIGFNSKKEPFDNPKVRQAISMMVNKEEMIEGVYEGFGIPAKGPLAPGIFGFNDDAKPIEYDVEEAKKLMKEAGYEDGFKTTVWTNDNPQRVDMAIILQNSLKELNIEVAVEQMEFGTYLDKTAQGEHDMFILGWSNPTGDADYGMYALFHSTQQGDAGNRSFYENKDVDKLLDEGRREADPDARLDIYNKIQEHLIEDAPMVYVHHQEYLVGISNDIEGFSIDTSGIYQLQDVKFVK
ncbi:glutathione ABC transporter substrate-binding protein [Sporosarcina sp. G11-34]|uniref:glutathione ABC transporter substrate-binding protein n=1 Tax=Sporosarcina sp. G11-34 TaxID=2849605 RepID=UPI0022A9D441|nr:glutathione ABC transporter substrate-binding protein [Sporosarcina sp. G11-34]MCZ2257244.1 glutathione ABC transporter substrate-binding protein [Sporosarcina sp. G11-34]